jgi:hypothetical protein
MKNYIFVIISLLLIIIIVFLLFSYKINKEGFNSDDYHIVCANYTKPVDFLKEINLSNTVVKKYVDVPNKAHEATSYLHYIIKNYENLPNNVIFIHDENESWHHSGKITENIERWIEEYEESGKMYYEFNNMINNKDGTNMPKDLYNTNPVFKNYWDTCFKKTKGSYDDALPQAAKCCAQFIVSKERILEKPKEFYTNMYDWLINNTTGEGNGDQNNKNSGHSTSRYAEWTWRYVFQ